MHKGFGTAFADFLKSNILLFSIIKEIIKAGGRCYLVGGSIRDLILGKKIKDIDIEVHNISIDKLQECLEKFGVVRLVGKQFGVLRVDGFDVDWSLPRTDSIGRKPTVTIDPKMSIEKAVRRRDVTINSMAIDLDLFATMDLSKVDETIIDKVNIIDPYGGYKDLKDKILRAVDLKLFSEDPLRFFRVMQFIGRFEMEPDEQLNNLCSKISLIGVARERIYEELKKLFLKSVCPSLGIRWLLKIDRLKEVMPEVFDLIGVPQKEDYHPEGDVFEHTMQAIDAAAELDQYELLVDKMFEEKNIENRFDKIEKQKLLIIWAVLCHDLGKAITTDANLHAYGHDEAGVALTKNLMKRFCDDYFLIKSVQKLVRYHLMPGMLLAQNSSSRAYKRLAIKLAPEVNMLQLGLVSLCDQRGRNSSSSRPLQMGDDEIVKFLNILERMQISIKPEAPILLGRHLADVIEPGPKMGKMLQQAYDIQIEEGIVDLEELKKRVTK